MTGKSSRHSTGAAKLRAAVAREELERLRVVFDLVGDAVFVLDSEGRLMEANRAACERYGYSHDELLRLNIAELDVPEERPLAAVRIARGIAEGGAVFEAVHQARDGRRIPTEVNTRVVRLGSTLYFISVCRDFTERRRSEQALRESEERLRLAVGAANQGLFDLNLQTGVATVTPEYARMLGYSVDEIQPTIDWWSDSLHPDDRGAALELLAACAAGQSTVYRTEYRLRARNGEWRWIQSTGTVVGFDADGKPARLIGIHTDLTDRRRAEEQLRVGERYEAVGLLAGGVAHNINNLMTVVVGYAEILLRSLRGDDHARSAAEHIRTAGNRAAAIAGQLMSFSRRQLLVPKLVEIGALVSGMADALAGVAGKDAALSVDAGPGGLVAEVDPDQFRRTVEELVANARDASIAGHRTIAVRCRQADVGEGVFTMTGVPIRPGSYALVEVADKGCGIDPAILPRIFDPFVSTREFGRGLGLPSIYGFVKQSDGFVSIVSPPGKGTTVSLYLPLVLRKL